MCLEKTEQMALPGCQDGGSRPQEAQKARLVMQLHTGNPTLRRLRQESCEFQESLGSILKP